MSSCGLGTKHIILICLPARDRNGENMTKIEMRGSELYKSSDMEMNSETAETVIGFHEVSFTQDNGSTQDKYVLDFESGKGLALNSTNLKFLIEKGIKEYEELIGKRLILKKEVRKLKMSSGVKEVIGIFITEIIDMNKQ